MCRKVKLLARDAAVLAMLDRNRDATAATSTTAASQGQDRYRVYTNAKNNYHNFGSALGVTYNFYKKFTIVANISYNKMNSSEFSRHFCYGIQYADMGNQSFIW